MVKLMYLNHLHPERGEAIRGVTSVLILPRSRRGEPRYAVFMGIVPSPRLRRVSVIIKLDSN